jgi:hypothetical protein
VVTTDGEGPADGSVVVNDDEAAANETEVYLYVMARHLAGQRWHVFQVSEESPRITLAGSVASYDDARKLAMRDGRPLRIAEQAWRQMADAGVAPVKVPDGVSIG